MQRILGLLLVITGIAAIFILLRFHSLISTPEPIVFASSPQDKNPRVLEIPSLNIKLNVIPATISNNKWSETENSLGYLTSSVLPNTNGNAVFYGHNRPAVLGKLNKIKIGDVVEITSGDGVVSKFDVYDKFEVTPDQTHILNNSETPKITIYTCSGFFDLKRFVVLAKPQ